MPLESDDCPTPSPEQRMPRDIVSFLTSMTIRLTGGIPNMRVLARHHGVHRYEESRSFLSSFATLSKRGIDMDEGYRLIMPALFTQHTHDPLPRRLYFLTHSNSRLIPIIQRQGRPLEDNQSSNDWEQRLSSSLGVSAIPSQARPN
jgi:hypothetical protein